MGNPILFNNKTTMANQNMSDINSVFQKGPMRNLIIVGAVVVVIFILKPWVQIGAGERGIVQNFGAVQDKVLGEGIHLKIPIVQTVIIMDVKI